MDAIIYSPWKVFFSLLLDSGMRPGEALELKWDDVDFENEKVTINRTLSHTRKDSIPELYLLKIILGIKNWKLEEPKTKRSRRTIPLTGQVVRNLKEHQKDQKAQILKAEPGTYLKHNFIFAANNGEPIYEQNIYNRHFIPLIEKAGLPQIRLYDLRHTCATLLLSAGENPKVVSEWLGHASIVLTLDTYSHVLPNMQQGATQKLENILYPESEAAK
jgi:integrase